MKVGQVVKVRSDIPNEEREYVGVPRNTVLGHKCTIDRIVAKKSENPLRISPGTPCDALEVTMLEGDDRGSAWWVPAAWAMSACMFEDVP